MDREGSCKVRHPQPRNQPGRVMDYWFAHRLGKTRGRHQRVLEVNDASAGEWPWVVLQRYEGEATVPGCPQAPPSGEPVVPWSEFGRRQSVSRTHPDRARCRGTTPAPSTRVQDGGAVVLYLHLLPHV